MLRRKALWVAAVGLGLAVAGALYLGGRERESRLPRTARSSALPPAFNKALKEARRQVLRSNFAPDAVRALARLYHANRFYDEARACYGLVKADRAGLNARDHYYLADLAQDAGDLETAAAELGAVVAEAPDYLPARLALANVLLKSGQVEEAEKAYQAVLAVEAGQPQAMFGLARMELRRGDDAAAVARLDALMAAHPEMTSAAGLYAQVLDRLGRRDRVPEMTVRSRQRPEPEPDDPWLDALLADCYDKQSLGLKFEEFFACGEVDRAVPLLGRFEQLDPSSPIPHVLRGVSFSRVKDEADAVKEYSRALEMGADPEKVCPHIELSLVALGRAPEAARILSDYHGKRPDSIAILTAYSDAVLAEGDAVLARRLLEELLAREPYLFDQNMSLARILWTAGEHDQAAACLRRAAEVSPKDPVSRSFLAQYYLEKGDPDAAIGPLEQALAQGAPSREASQRLTTMLYGAYVLAGEAVAAKGEGERAVSHYYDQAIFLVPGNPAAYAGKAKACAKLGRLAEAEKALKTLLSLEPTNPTVYLSLGDVYSADGSRDDARQNWQKAYDLAPASYADLRAALRSRLDGAEPASP
jgi:tetratricopeptide (TPR) repeat protein